ncbi:MAG: transposase, partial [Spirochaetes bacterium]|nr:transposase [Spirochaetota bacterium]
MKDDSKLQEEDISLKLYKDYSRFKTSIFTNLIDNNPEIDKIILLKNTQKLLDRLLFIFFAEDRGLLPPNTISKIIEDHKKLEEMAVKESLYARYKAYFNFINKGEPKLNIPEYNGGLFAPDEMLDSVIIDDDILTDEALNLSKYDFLSDIDVNILGHIFENSLNDVEELQAIVQGEAFDKTKTKRKKDGVYYTPKYITKYIVDNTVGALCEEKKEELNLLNINLDTNKEYKRLTKDKKDLLERLYKYQNYLVSLKILDPACGSGAFLNQALEYLLEEHDFIDTYRKVLEGDALGFFDTKAEILEHNLFGVDINEEAVEIAKLSLWLRTAERGRTLNKLSDNIKCGNSLIDDPEVAGELAFDWGEEFGEIMKGKPKVVEAFHVTWITHNSRVSQRMVEYNVKKGEGIWLDNKQEIKITEIIRDIVIENNYKCLSYNICGDHIHMLLLCSPDELPMIMKTIKGKSSQKYHRNKGDDTEINKGINPLVKEKDKKSTSLWAQKYDARKIEDDDRFANTINYINFNREKHQLPESKRLKPLVAGMICNYDDAFEQYEPGGFDVVIG